MNLEAVTFSDPSSATSHHQKSLPSENSAEIAEPPISQMDSGNDAGDSLVSLRTVCPLRPARRVVYAGGKCKGSG